MPSDLIINVRQVGSYPQLLSSTGQEQLLVQQGGLGGPYASMDTGTLVQTAANSLSIGVGTTVPIDAIPGHVFTNTNHVLPIDASLLWNAYFGGAGEIVSWQGGQSAAITFGPSGYSFEASTIAQPDQPPNFVDLMNLDPAGHLTLPFSTLTVARDPAASNEVATSGWVSNNTVQSFNARKGQVQLNAQDVYNALKLCDPLATQPWVNQAITNSIQNLLYTCPFVNTWNGRQGQVYLMLSDITCVFYQSGQQPISPTPLPTSNDDSIATTAWVTNAFTPGGGTFLPLSGGTMSGPLVVTATGATTPRSVQAEFGDVANVLDFGADPMNAQDSTPAFNAAAQAVSASTRLKAVYVPTGSYRINGQINLANGQSLYGDGRGSSVLIIDQAFSPTATSVIFMQSGTYDPGPVVRDLGIVFVQPLNGSNRVNYLTLANGGTPQTGIRYPWTIAAGASSGRIWLQNVRISGAWDGITSNGNGALYWLDNVEIGALDCGLSLGEGGTAVLDWAHLSDIEFWNFGLDVGAYMDGETIAMRIGAQNGLDGTAISCFSSRVIFTSEASACWGAIANLSMDGDGATLEIADVQWLQISNFYTTCSATGVGRPAVAINGGIAIDFVNWFSSNASDQPHLALNSAGTDVSVSNGFALAFNTQTGVFITANGTLRLGNLKVRAANDVAWGQPLIQQTFTGVLQVDNLDVSGNAGSSGTAIQMNGDNAGNVLGNAIALGAGWITNIAGGPNGNYGALPLTGGTLSGGLHFGAQTAAAPDDLSRHIELFTNYAGFNVTAGQLNYWTGGNHVFSCGGTEVMELTSSSMQVPTLPATPSYANDAAAAAGGVAVGQFYRDGSAVMVRVT